MWTMSTLMALDWVIHRSDGRGLLRFPRVTNALKAGNAVRVPPRAHCFRRSRASGARVFRGTGGGAHLSGVDKAVDEAM